MPRRTLYLYTTTGGEKRGPFSARMIREMAGTGEIVPSTELTIVQEGNSKEQHVLARRVKKLFTAPRSSSRRQAETGRHGAPSRTGERLNSEAGVTSAQASQVLPAKSGPPPPLPAKSGPPPLLPAKSGPPPLPSREGVGPALAAGLAAGVVAATLLDGGDANAASSVEGVVFADLDDDGVVDSAFGDMDGDGVLDHGVVDIDGDGLVDMGFADMNQDGAIDAVIGDANADGILDHAVIDSDFDGVADASWVDTDMDGVVDVDEIGDLDDGGFVEDLFDLF